MNKQILFTTIALLFILYTNSEAQKVKYKNEQVLVNKEHKFDFVQIENGEPESGLKQYSLKDLEGNIVLTLTDTIFYYTKLPNETVKRKAYEAYNCSAPQLGLNAIIPFNNVMNYPKQRINDLKKVGFFKDFELTEKRFNDFVKKQGPKAIDKEFENIEKINTNRLVNYELSKEKTALLQIRVPGKVTVERNINPVKGYKNSSGYIIKDGATKIGEFILVEKDSYKPSVVVMNNDKVKIAHGEIIKKPIKQMGLEKYLYSLKVLAYKNHHLEKNFKKFSTRAKSMGSQESIQEKLEKMAVFLVNEGLL
jgi:hypothetical protein